ncbi:MAG: helix-turn-helix domain-containing protein, partial [Myxococcota bacterium]|nr:helix-turn-helix domain-containing protein [Myxococcota bacterium]
MSLALWLRAGRAQRGLSLDDIARVTKIQPRILERLEAGSVTPGDGMPADVFVRGFVRSVAKCVGLDEHEAVRRYNAAVTGVPFVPTTTLAPASASARAVVAAMADLAPLAARASSD